ncbi:MAG TPA: hypothetical protein VF648_00480 [Pyrinomonadaceae bacterium]|jgi:hypothetical protein
MKKEVSNFTDFFLRYSSDVPQNEVDLHQVFSSKCACKPDVTFDEENGWRTFIHQELKGENS